MKEPGHIYILINPSIEGLLKIGKSTRTPELRAKEISQATGVPTPFSVAFSIEVNDCHSAEEYVFAVLEHNGFKRTANREFFELPLRSAIKVLMLVEKELQEQTGVSSQIETNDLRQPTAPVTEAIFPEHPGAAIFEKAADAYYGLGGEIEDKKEAIRFLEHAKTLNFGPAYTSLAEHLIYEAEALRRDDDVAGMLKLHEQALEVLKTGAQKGHGRCYVKMAELYSIRDQAENTNKCWRKFFQSETFLKDGDQKWGACASIGSAEEGGQPRANYARQYLFEVFMHRIPLDPEILRILHPLRSEVLSEIESYVNCFSPERQPKSLENGQRFLAFGEATL